MAGWSGHEKRCVRDAAAGAGCVYRARAGTGYRPGAGAGSHHAARRSRQAEPERPVTPQIAPSTNGMHTVQRGDTLYAIAFANNLDYREIASWNQLESADRIMVGQVLRLTPPPGAVEIKPLEEVPPPSARPLTEPPLLTTPQAVLLRYSEANWAQVSRRPDRGAPPLHRRRRASQAVPRRATPSPAPPVASVPAATAPASADIIWLWPADGTLAGRFGAAGGKGIDIVGPRNAPVVAVAPGKVVYSGSGLRGYGRLLIVKHRGRVSLGLCAQ